MYYKDEQNEFSKYSCHANARLFAFNSAKAVSFIFLYDSTVSTVSTEQLEYLLNNDTINTEIDIQG